MLTVGMIADKVYFLDVNLDFVMNTQSTSCILFDLDGTISDPADGILHSFNYALDHFGYKTISRESIAKYIGPPLDESFALLTGSDDVEHICALVAEYRTYFAKVGYSENHLYPGIEEVLLFLKEKKITLGICTSKRKDFAEMILKMFGVGEYFSFVSGGDIGIKKACQIEQLLSSNSIGTSTIMVGDRAIDVTAAQQNGIDSAGVLWGYGTREELEKVSPGYIFENVGELRLLAG